MTKTEELIQQIELGVEETQAEHPDMNPDDIYWEIMTSVCTGHSLAVHNEVRRHFGFDELKVR